MSPSKQIEVLLLRLCRRERLVLAARVLLHESDVCDHQLAIVLRDLARDEADGKTLTADPGHTSKVAAALRSRSKNSKLSNRRQETLGHLTRGLSEREWQRT